MIHFAINAKILTVERAGKLDRYGDPIFEVVAINVDCNLKQSTRRVLNQDGVTASIDGTLKCYERFEEGDVFTIEARLPSRWKVYSVTEAQDPATGGALFWSYMLVKQRGEDAV
ncbi:MAG: hypothetical protein JSW58_08340 [Candidatus Latescibacterota bacterium]|nr:MAG: hypothetical protein JSW58_08340 [Candidatus Latescibacterota bacterium]